MLAKDQRARNAASEQDRYTLRAATAGWSGARLEAAALQEHGAELGVQLVILDGRLCAHEDGRSPKPSVLGSPL